MNRRGFIVSLFTILPAATQYKRVWRFSEGLLKPRMVPRLNPEWVKLEEKYETYFPGLDPRAFDVVNIGAPPGGLDDADMASVPLPLMPGKVHRFDMEDAIDHLRLLLNQARVADREYLEALNRSLDL